MALTPIRLGSAVGAPTEAQIARFFARPSIAGSVVHSEDIAKNFHKPARRVRLRITKMAAEGLVALADDGGGRQGWLWVAEETAAGYADRAERNNNGGQRAATKGR